MAPANVPKRRKFTAREDGVRRGVSPRTVRRKQAEPRERFLARAEERMKQVRDLRREGLTITQVAEWLDITYSAAYSLDRRGKERGL